MVECPRCGSTALAALYGHHPAYCEDCGAALGGCELIPEQIRRFHRDDEIRNMDHLFGWAIGTVVEVRDGEEERTIEDAWLELFNGEGTAGEFGGVRFHAVIDPEEARHQDVKDLDGYIESYAYGTRDAFEERDRSDGWYVSEYQHPEDPDIGAPAPYSVRHD